uniref:Uncharacterized protein n=1 Tax=Hyaloperonospora arabidopsidis (strain Emoy2) TaxID=559515 RepID=M4BZS0_HYAAE
MGSSLSKGLVPQPQVPSNWNATHIPSQKDKVAIVTGANSGIGYCTALELARKGAHVVLACRNRERGLKAETDMRALLESVSESGTVELMLVDMADLSSVHKFCEEFKKTHNRLDVLVNNAGIVGGAYTKTVDGYELQFATNYLGHFALTAQLFELLKKSEAARIVSVSSFLHRHASLFFDEEKIMVTKPEEYGQVAAYTVSKLCNLLFTLELDRRLKAAKITNVVANAAHPGYCDTNIMKKAAQTNSDSWLWWLMFRTVAMVTPQSPEKGALSTLYAATSESATGGGYYGPKYLELYGLPARVDSSSLSKSEEAAAKLWSYSEKLAHLQFDVAK